MNALTYISSILLLSVLLALNAALQWSSTPKNGDILYSCAGQDITLAWDFTLDPGDVIHSIEWTYEGRSQETVAMAVHGNFLPLPAFSHRVQHLPEAGIILLHLTKEDVGNYSVMVTGHDSSGASFETRRTVLLQVADNLMTTDHELHAGQQAGAEYSNATHEWHAVLTCGRFTYPRDPPMSVEWLTPEGQTLPSTLYSEGLFKLLLPNPVTEGNFTCRISASAVNVSCAHGHGKQASIVVNGLLTRLVLMEARQEKLQAENEKKDAVINELTTNQQRLQAEKDAEINELKTQLEVLKEKIPRTIAFSAKLSSSQHLASSAPLILPTIILNEGDAYNSSTGRFTAPVTGTYYFSAMTAAYVGSNYANLRLRSNSAAGDLFFSYAYSDGHGQSGSLQGAVPLQRGDQVWLTAGTNSYFEGGTPTVFSGFLLFVG